MIYLDYQATTPLATEAREAMLRRLDPALEESAWSLGHSRARTVRTVVLPQLRPAVLGGALLVGLHLLAEFGALSLLRLRLLQVLALLLLSCKVRKVGRPVAAHLGTGGRRLICEVDGRPKGTGGGLRGVQGGGVSGESARGIVVHAWKASWRAHESVEFLRALRHVLRPRSKSLQVEKP